MRIIIMKKYILLSIMALFAVASLTAQDFKTRTGLAGATMAGTTPDTIKATVKGYSAVLGLQVLVVKNSGTVAGSVIGYGKLVGTNDYVAIGDTLTLTNVARQTKVFSHASPVYVDYIFIGTGSGTMNATLSGTAVPRAPK